MGTQSTWGLRKEASTYHFVTINISIDMRLISLFIVCTVITRGVPQLRRIEAKIADNFESGTDCDVRLKLKNPGKTGSCRTKVLDEPHINNWARAGTEVYNFKGSCGAGWKSRENLQFKILLGPSIGERPCCYCVDHLQLVSVRVYLRGGRYLHWSGKHWFTPTSGWMDFDFEGQTDTSN